MRRLLFLTLTIVVLLHLNSSSQAPSAWIPVPPPKEQIGIYVAPNLAVVGDRLHLIFAGTNPKAIHPEVMQCWRSERDENWSEVRAPFFGLDFGRVRNVAVGTTRYAMALVFQRQLTQGDRAFEIDFTLTADNGWEWIQPVLVDSFVSESPRGTSIAVAGREYAKKTEFAAAWGTEGHGVKAALISLRDSVRAPAKSVGYHSALSDKVMIGGHSKGGFGVVWSDSNGLRSVQIKAISGEAGKPVTLVNKDVQNNFAVGARPRGGLELITNLGQESFLFGWDNGEWKRQTSPAPPANTPPPVPGPNPACTLDREDKMHVIYQPTGTSDVMYVNDRSGGWSVPEKVFTMKSSSAPFTIACSENYVWAAYAHGTHMVIAKRPLK